MNRTINLSYDTVSEILTVEGIQISLFVLPQLIHQLTHPDERKWYRFERKDDNIIVHVRINEEEPHGTPIANLGEPSPQANSGRQGQETPH
jgi:hypothetical protein